MDEMGKITEVEAVEMRWWWCKPAMTFVRRIAGLTGGKTVVKIDGPIKEGIAAKIAKLTDEKIGGRIGSSIGVRTDRRIVERIIGQTQVGSSADWIERIMSPGNMGAMGERMPA